MTNCQLCARGLCLTVLGLTACGGAAAAIDVALVVDRNVNDPGQVVSLLRAVRVVLDSPDGLYPTDAARDASEIKLQDLDGDGDLELWTDVGVLDLGRLPRVRIERGGLRDVPVDLRFDGLGRDDPAPAAGQVVAAGGVRGLQFETAQIREVEVPFNLKLRYRPPQVTQVIPADGAAEGKVASVFVVFPKRMDAESLRAAGTIELRQVDGGRNDLISATEIGVQFLPGDESPTTAEYRLAQFLQDGQYRLSVSSAARDTDGRPLDQVPLQPGNQSYSSAFSVSVQAEITGMACPAGGPCTDGPCAQGGSVCAGELLCEAGACKPRGCPAQCATGLVCDPDQAMVCVPDCRVHGTYGGCPAGASCAADGLCR